MWLTILLFVPLIVFCAAMVLGKGRISIKEFLIAEILMSLLICVGFFVARHQSVSDTEIWNGWITKGEFYEEWWERVSCRHPISCSHRDKNGNTLHSNDGYYHAYDVDYHAPYWQITTSNQEVVSIDSSYFDALTGWFGNKEYVLLHRFSVHRGPGNKYETKYLTGSSRFIPTAVEHSFVNYIKASPNSVLRRMGQGEKFITLIPPYPRVKDQFVCDRVIPVGMTLPNLTSWNAQFAEINARLGAKRQVNIVLVVVNTSDSAYVHSLEEKWLGGKKNDFVIIVGTTQYPVIDWVRIASWSKKEDLKVELRDAIQDLGSLEKREEILKTIETQVGQKFVRTPMADFEYLMASWQPSFGVLTFLLILGFFGSCGVAWFFAENEVLD